MAVKFSNNAKTLLSSGITSSATSISVSDASAWPTLYTGDYSLATLVDISDNTIFEIVKVTAINSNTLTVARGQEGTTARAFNSGDKVELRLTAGLLEQALTGTDVVKLDSLTASATASYSLAVGGVAYSPANANALIVSLNGVTQEPNSAFTVSGSTITFSSALTANDSIDYIVDMAKTLDIGEPSDNTVSPDKLTSAVNLDAITDNGATTNNAVTVGALTSNGTVEFDGLSGTGSVEVTDILDQDDMSSNSATALATQQSIKAYVDAQVDTADALPEVLANGNTTGGTDIAVSSGDDITFADSSKARFGAGSDLNIFHDGTNSLISNEVGDLYIRNFANDKDISLRTDNGSGGHTTYLLADGSTGSTELYHYGSKKIATTSSGVEVIGTVDADTGKISRPSTFWSTEYIGISNYGSIATQGNYDLHITSNGYRNSSGTWTSFGLNSKTGAAQIALDPDGEIGFNTEASKASGTGTGVTRRMTLSDSTFDVNVNLDVDGFMRSTGEIRSGTHVIAGRQAMGATGGEVALTINDGQGNANVTFNHTDGVPDQDGNSARIVVNTDSTSAANFQFELASNVTGSTTHHTTPIFRIDEQGVEVTGETHTDTLDVTKDVASTVIATMENPNVTASHVLKLTGGGGGSGTKLLECVGGSNGTVFEVLGNGAVNIGGDITDVGGITSQGVVRGTTTTGSGTPTFSFDGDTNTGMYHLSADHLGFTTGGTTRCIMDSVGNIGFGTDPTAQGTYKVVELKSTHADAGGYIRLQGTTSTTRASIFNFSSTMYLESQGGSFSFRDNSGNVKALISEAHITSQGASSPYLRAMSASNANYVAALKVHYAEESMSLRGGSDYKILATDGYSVPSNIKFYASNDLKMKLKNDNQLLIGTTCAQGGTAANAGVCITDSNNSNTSARLALKSNVNTFLRFGRFGTAADSLMTIANNYHRDSGNYAADNTGRGVSNITFRADGEIRMGVNPAGYNSPLNYFYLKNNGKLLLSDWDGETARGQLTVRMRSGMNLSSGGHWNTHAAFVGEGSFGGGYALADGTRGYLAYCADSGNDYYIQGSTSLTGTLTGGVYINNRGTSWSGVSDIRTKVIDRNIDGALDKLAGITPVIGRYNWDDEGKERSFVIAQEIQSVFPQAVTVDHANSKEGEDPYLGVEYTSLVPLLISAIKEQSATIETLTQRIEQLEAN